MSLSFEKQRKIIFDNPNVRNIAYKKQFWKTMKPFFWSKFGDDERITLIEGGKVVSEDEEVAETFRLFFETVAKSFHINCKFMSDEPVGNESVNNIIRKFQNHTSVIKMKGILVFQLLKYKILIGKLIHLMHLRPFSKMMFQYKNSKETVIFFLNLLCLVLTKVYLLQGFLTFSKMQRLNQFPRKIYNW